MGQAADAARVAGWEEILFIFYLTPSVPLSLIGEGEDLYQRGCGPS